MRAAHAELIERAAAKDFAGMVAHSDPDLVTFEPTGPLRYVGRDGASEVWRQGLDAATGDITMDTAELTVQVVGDLAVTWGLDHVQIAEINGARADSWVRATRVFHRREGQWLLVHQHLSFPLDPETGQGRADLRP